MILGLTGSIAMGKSTTADMFKKLGCPVFDADRAVHKLYDVGGEAAREIGRIYPDLIDNGMVNRPALVEKIAKEKTVLSRIEKIVHPMVRSLEKQFVSMQNKLGKKIIVLDIPLLFESDRTQDVDVVVVVSTTPDIQLERAMARPAMTAEKLDMILSRQTPDKEKRDRADYVIDTSKSFADTFNQVKALVKKLDPANPCLEV